MRITGRITLALLGMGLTSCRHSTAGSDALHNFGEMTASNDAGAFWQPMTAESLSNFDESTTYLYPSSHPMVRRIQAWADAMHAEILKTKPAVMPPQPQVRILRSKSFNAFVTQKRACMPVHLTVQKAMGDGDQETMGDDRFALENTADKSPQNAAFDTLKIYKDGFFRVSEGSDDDECLKIKPELARLKQVLQFSLKDSARCITLASQGAAGDISGTIDVRCFPEDKQIYFGPSSQVRRIRFGVIPSVITLFDRIVKDLSEEEVVAILAHELGHYYRLHGIVSSRLYDFAYQLDATHNLGSRPKPVPENDVLAKLGSEVNESSLGYLQLKTSSSQKLHSYFFKLFESSEPGHLCDHAQCKSACKAVKKHLDLKPMKSDEILQGFPAVSLPNTQTSQAFYKDFENLALACAETIDVRKHGFEISDWLRRGGLKRKIDVSLLNKVSTLKDVILSLPQKDLDGWIKAQNDEIFALFKRADESRLGIYTDEQEADEVGIELSSRVGIKPEAAQKAFLKSLEFGEKQSGGRSPIPGELDFAQCSAALKQGFTEFVPIGDYADIHHSTCFRVYNVFREVKAHAADLRALPTFTGIKPDPNQWKSIQQQAK